MHSSCHLQCFNLIFQWLKKVVIYTAQNSFLASKQQHGKLWWFLLRSRQKKKRKKRKSVWWEAWLFWRKGFLEKKSTFYEKRSGKAKKEKKKTFDHQRSNCFYWWIQHLSLNLAEHHLLQKSDLHQGPFTTHSALLPDLQAYPNMEPSALSLLWGTNELKPKKSLKLYETFMYKSAGLIAFLWNKMEKSVFNLGALCHGITLHLWSCFTWVQRSCSPHVCVV